MEIERQVENVRAALRKMIVTTENEKGRQRLQEELAAVEKSMPEKLRANTDRTLKYYFAVRGPASGGERYVEFARVNRETHEAEPASIVLARAPFTAHQPSLHFQLKKMITVSDSGFYVGQEPQQLGRLTGTLAGL